MPPHDSILVRTGWSKLDSANAHHEKGFTILVLSDGITSGMNLRVKSEVRVGHELHLRDSLTIFIVTS